MYSIRLVLVLSVFCASFNIYIFHGVVVTQAMEDTEAMEDTDSEATESA